jgi:hypothetical protein
MRHGGRGATIRGGHLEKDRAHAWKFRVAREAQSRLRVTRTLRVGRSRTRARIDVDRHAIVAGTRRARARVIVKLRSPSFLPLVLLLALVACSSADGSKGFGSSSPDAASADDASDSGSAPSSYPPAPYGLQVGQTFPNASLPGYRDGAGSWTTISFEELYDPDGSRGIRGIYVNLSAPWCAACQAEGQDLPSKYASSYRAKGARFVTALLEDAQQQPASRATLDTWIAQYHTNFDIVADGELTLVPKSGSSGGSIPLPYNYVVDPRTMRITQINSGPFMYGGVIPGLDTLLTKNGAP